ncbi:MAG: PEP-CTERM sorting domain-containing protein [Burkholderiaceae bacterium]|nr:PEP-CTERM sorting domain-containing protein [Burkholderiaceae bacterium]
MNLKPVFAAVVLIAGMSAASATTSLDLGPATVTYDESTDFGFISSWFSSSTTFGFSWTVPNSAAVASFGPLTIVSVPLPSFTLARNAGWALSDASAFLGNLSFTEVGGATTNIVASASVSINGGPAVPIGPASLAWAVTGSGPGYMQGYFADSATFPGGFKTLAVTGAGIDLSATGGVFSSISAQPQNKFEISFAAAPVPEPETYAMLLAGLATLAWLSKRRSA